MAVHHLQFSIITLSGQSTALNSKTRFLKQYDQDLQCMHFYIHLYKALLYGQVIFVKFLAYQLNCDGPKLSYRQVWANSADPDQTAPRGAVTVSYSKCIFFDKVPSFFFFDL